MAAPRTDIAIVNYRGASDVLQALARLTGWHDGVIWVVDNSAHEPEMRSQADALQAACAQMAAVRLLQPGENLGFGRACNLAFAQSDAEFFLLLNPDARIGIADIQSLALAMQQRPALAAVSPALYWNAEQSFAMPLTVAQTPWHTLLSMLSTWSARVTRQLAVRRLQKDMQTLREAAPVDVAFLTGAVLLLRRAAALKAGGLFDPDYFMFFEDSDLSLRLRRAGYALAIWPQARAVHEYRHKAFKAGLMAQSQQLYFQKNFPRFFHWTDGLHHVGRWSRQQPTPAWDTNIGQSIVSAAELARLTAGCGVRALSPSIQMAPAIFRPAQCAAIPLSESEWALLEPGAYVALTENPAQRDDCRWIRFEKT